MLAIIAHGRPEAGTGWALSFERAQGELHVLGQRGPVGVGLKPRLKAGFVLNGAVEGRDDGLKTV
jgi:hypothetical protein